jgi:hypothetical protein
MRACLRVLLRNFLAGTEENQCKTVRLVGALAKSQTRLLPNISLQQGYPTFLVRVHSCYGGLVRAVDM